MKLKKSLHSGIYILRVTRGKHAMKWVSWGGERGTRNILKQYVNTPLHVLVFMTDIKIIHEEVYFSGVAYKTYEEALEQYESKSNKEQFFIVGIKLQAEQIVN